MESCACISLSPVGDGLDAWNVGIASEEGVVNEPGDATWIVSEAGLSLQFLLYWDLLAIFDLHYARRIGNDNGGFMIEREIFPSISLPDSFV